MHYRRQAGGKLATGYTHKALQKQRPQKRRKPRAKATRLA